MDFQFFLEPPELSYPAELEIEALSPLSMVPSQPGIYYRSQAAPTHAMILGMLENVLGWHFSEEMRKGMIKLLAKAAKKAYGRNSDWKDHPWLLGKAESSESGYVSLLQYHLDITLTHQPFTQNYDDLWSQHLRDDGGNFVGGSRSYDFRLEPLIAQSRKEDKSPGQSGKSKKYPKFVEFGDRADHKAYDSLDELLEQKSGKIKAKSIHPYFPRYYVSPKVRGYVIPQEPYRYRIATTPKLARMLEAAIIDPVAPPYLGSNDGWVHLNWKNHDEL